MHNPDLPRIKRCCPPSMGLDCNLWSVQIHGYGLGLFHTMQRAALFVQARENFRVVA